MAQSSPSDSSIVWDAPPTSPSGIVWDPVSPNGADLQSRAEAAVHGAQSDYFPNMASAAGKEIVQIARNAMNLGSKIVPDALIPDSVKNFSSDAAIKQADAADQPTFQAPGGGFGRALGGTAVTAPVAGGVELALGSDALKSVLPGALKFLTSAPVRSAASGATAATMTSPPDERGTSALEGGLLGGALGAGQSALGRTMGGLVQKDPALLRLHSDVDSSNLIPGAAQRKLFVPISQGASTDDLISGFAKRFYRSALPYAPGVETLLGGQAGNAEDAVRGSMLQKAAPEGYVVPASATNDLQLSTKLIKDKYDEIYNNLRQIRNVTTPKDFSTELATRIKAADPQIPASDVDNYVSRMQSELEHQAENSSDGRINGWNLKNVRDFAQSINSDLPMPQRAGLTDTTKGYIDDIFSKKYQQAFQLGNQKQMDILGDYKTNAPNYENFAPLRRAVNASRANSGEFRFGQVANKAHDFTDIQGMDQDAKAVLGKGPVQLSQMGRIMTYPVIAGAAKFGGVLPIAGVVGAADAMATKGAQNILYGDTALQKSMDALIRNNPRLAAALGTTLRTAATSNVGED